MLDITAVLGQFVDRDGKLTFPPGFNLPLFAEKIFATEVQAGVPDYEQFTFHTYPSESEHNRTNLTRRQLNTRVKTVAARLQEICEPGDHVAIMCNNSPEYVYGFTGAIYANTVPVPLYDPTEPGHAAHLAAVLKAAEPKVVLTNKACAATVRSYFSDRPGSERPRIIAVDAQPDIDPTTYQLPDFSVAREADGGAVAPVDQLAFLQFTSGSTRTPAGVEITHRQIIANALQIFFHGRFRTPARAVLWLPLHHDMGLILAVFFLVLGSQTDLLAPRDFIQHPKRWIELLDRREGEGHGEGEQAIYTVGPNFSLGLASRFANPAHVPELKDVDLSALEGLVCGSEPVTEPVVREFLEVFEPYGFPRRALRPSYGMAEASLLVTTPSSLDRPKVVWVDREKLGEGTVEKVAVSDPTNPPSTATAITAVGDPALQRVAVVDPETGQEVPDGTVGEVWIWGENVARGYLNNPESTAHVFANHLPADKRLDNSHAAGVPADANWLASGDLGTYFEGEICITGRLKDLIVIGGRNHYPQDIELTAQLASDHVRPESVAAFAMAGQDSEELIIVAERKPGSSESGDAEAINAIRGAVTTAHGITPKDIRFVPADAIPRSTAAKIARRVTRAAYEKGHFEA